MTTFAQSVEFFDVVRRQRACRAFRPDPVDDATVQQLLDAAVHAPSAENRQPWVFVVVRDPRERAAIGELTRRRWEGGARELVRDRMPTSLLEDVDRGARGGIAGAPVLVVVCGRTDAVHPHALAPSILPAVQNLLLAATALGLGSALTTLPVGGDQLSELLALPEAVAPMALVPVGWPATALGASHRRPVSEVAHRDVYGAGW